MEARYTLRDHADRPFPSAAPGRFGGHAKSRIYGRLDCRAARAAIARGGPYPRHRVFFADEVTAVSAGYRPCAICMPQAYAAWQRPVALD